MAFCDFCTCEDCKNGTKYILHAKTSSGKWICDVCYSYDECVKQKRENGEKQTGPCDDKNCAHRPKLVGKWSKK